MRDVRCHEERRQEIVQAAKALFSKFGVEHTSISQLVKEIGVAHGLFYYYFKSKEEVMEAVIETMLKDFTKMLEERLKAADDDFHAQLAVFINTVFDSCPRPAIDFRLRDIIMSSYHDQVLAALHAVSKTIWAKGVAQGILTMPHSGLIFQIVLSGSLSLAEKGQVTREVAVELMIQMLGLSSGAMRRWM